MFADMAAKGKQLSGSSGLGHGWTFTDAPPEDAIFDLAHEDDPSPDYFAIFEAAGWTPVLSVGNIHIFKAAPGTPPVHRSTDSYRDELTRQRGTFARCAAIALAILVAVWLTVRATDWPRGLDFALLLPAWIAAVYTVLPLIGYTYRLWRLRPAD